MNRRHRDRPHTLTRWGSTALAILAAATGQWPAAAITAAVALAAWAARPR